MSVWNWGRLVFAPALVAAVLANPAGAQELRMTNLYDAFGRDHPGATFDWGFAALIEWGETVILFDAGNNADLLASNIEALDVDLGTVDFAVLSHSHPDHAAGFDFVLRERPGLPLYLPTDMNLGATIELPLLPAPTPGVEDSLPPEQLYYQRQAERIELDLGDRFWNANTQWVDDHRELSPGVHLITTYSSKWSLPELTLALETDEGLVVVTGCSHSGVSEIVDESMVATGQKIRLLAGGFHLAWHTPDDIEALATSLRDEFGVAAVAPAHCTGHAAFKILGDVFGDRYEFYGLGTAITLPE